MSVIQEATKIPIDFIIACKYHRNLTLEINKAIKASDFELIASYFHKVHNDLGHEQIKTSRVNVLQGDSGSQKN